MSLRLRPESLCEVQTMIELITVTTDRFIDKGTWYQSAVSGFWYQNKDSAGDICAIRVDGKTTYQPEPEKEDE